MIILDTNVLSELMRPVPAAEVARWIASRPAAGFYVTSITQAEILHGILLLPKGRRRQALESAAQALFTEDFAERTLPFGGDAAVAYAEIAAGRSRLGRPISQFDAQIAAIARIHGAPLATRNVDDFQGCGITVANPWERSA
jgi:predicted nucleic acid-binding protein